MAARATHTRERIVTRLIEEEMRESFLDYSMSVIVQRALPDVRDGLKPVHRRIIYAMYELGLRPDRPYKKSATVVGDVLGKYHPHGDSAVYDALVRMVQDFSLRMPLIDGQGNFGSIDGDPAAAYRYTEARLQELAVELIDDIRKGTVEFQPNFDGQNQEPVVLPARFPNLLVNGSAGIAVGMSTNVPPHNLAEIAAGVRQLAVDPECSIDDLMRHVPGPDFPTGGFILGGDGIRAMYTEGRGRIVVRARLVKELVRGGKQQIVVTELPYGVSKTKVIAQIVGLTKSGRVSDIADVRDESDRDGMRLVVELKRGADAEGLLAKLYKSTSLRVTFGAHLLALDSGEPQVFTLKELLERFRDHRLEVVRRRSRHDLERASAERHVVEGLLVALAHIDEAVRIIRSAKDRASASTRLQDTFGLSEVQAAAILDMRLAKLTALERSQLRLRLDELTGIIARLRDILDSEEVQLDVVIEELGEVVERFSDGRRTVILTEDDVDDGEAVVEEQLAEEDVVVTLTRQGFIKRIPMHVYRRRIASGKALSEMERYADDHLERVFVAGTGGHIVVFTAGGRCLLLPVLDVPEISRATRGRSLYALLGGADRDDRIVAALPVGDPADDVRFVVFATRLGNVKRTPLAEFQNAGSGGVIAAGLREEDAVVDVRLSDGVADVMLLSRRGRAIRFPESEVNVLGRAAMGVRGISLVDDGDRVVAMLMVRRGADVLTATEDGHVRRTPADEFSLQRRGGRGMLVSLGRADGGVTLVGALEAVPGDGVVVATEGGIDASLKVDSLPAEGRRSLGRRALRLEVGDRVIGLTRIAGGGGGEVGRSVTSGAVANEDGTVAHGQPSGGPSEAGQLGLLD